MTTTAKSGNAEKKMKEIRFQLPGALSRRLQKKCGASESVLYKYLVALLLVLIDRYHYDEGRDYLTLVPLKRIPHDAPFKVMSDMEGEFRVNMDGQRTFRELLVDTEGRINGGGAVYAGEIQRIGGPVILRGFHNSVCIDTSVAAAVFIFDYQGKDGTRWEISLQFQYHDGRYSAGYVEGMGRHFSNLTESALGHERQTICRLNILDAEEKRQLLYQFNPPPSPFPDDTPVHCLFEAQADRMPDKAALVCGVYWFTYRELDRYANRVAHYLHQGKSLPPEEPVGIMLEPGYERVVAVLGVLKAGGTYVPIDPVLPVKRIKYMLEDAAIRILISQKGYADKLKYLRRECSQLNHLLNFQGGGLHNGEKEEKEFRQHELLRRLNRFPCHRLPHVNAHSRGSAYIIYTSGSTGKPKGVVLEHRSLVNLCYWHNRYYGITRRDNAALYAGFSFDASVWEVFPYLLKGAALHALPDSIKLDVELVNRYFQSRQLTVAFLPTAFCELFMEIENHSLRILLTGGDKLHKFVPAGYRLFNNYGPTENTVVTTAYHVERFRENIPIGRPVDNHRVYILGRRCGALQPVGVAGQLCIAGDGLARGYLQQPELTAEKFIPNPFKHGERLYLTGDLALWLPGGNIQFLGRIDQQVKIRGVRIEIGEIENRLLELAEVDEAVVVADAWESGEKFLCACFVPARERGSADGDAIRHLLEKRLPQYMIPAYFLPMEHIPLTANGKVDRQAISRRLVKRKQSGYVAPATGLEHKLTAIWAEILNCDENVIGVHDNFLKLGGHSLKVAIMSTKIHQLFNVKLSIAEIFSHVTVRKLARYIEKAGGNQYHAIPVAEKRQYYPQYSAQKRLYILQQMDPRSTAYNIQLLNAQYRDIEREKLEEAFRLMIKRHEILRTSFHMREGEAIQIIRPDVSFSLEWYESCEGRRPERDTGRRQRSVERRRKVNDGRDTHDPHGESKLPGVPVFRIVEEFIRPFSLAEPPLFRVGLINVRNVRQTLMLDIHHIVCDGISIEIFMEELWRIYQGETLPPQRIQYKDFALWSLSRTAVESIKRQQEFWLNEFSGTIPFIHLPIDFPRPVHLTFEGSSYAFLVDKEVSGRLRRLAGEEGSTLYIMLLTLFYVLLYKLTGQEDIVVGTATAGRGHVQLQRLLGMFVNTLALRNYPRGEKSLKTFQREVENRTLQAFDNQDFQLEELVALVHPHREPGRNPLFDVSFGLENQFRVGDSMIRNVLPGGPKPYNFKPGRSKFDLTLLGAESDDGVQFLLEYNSVLFQPKTIERFCAYYVTLLNHAATEFGKKIYALNIMPEAEKKRILVEFNDTAVPYSAHKTIHRLFEEQVERTPHRIALVGKKARARGLAGSDEAACNDVHLSYRQLMTRAAALAFCLREKGVGRSHIVPVLVDRSPDMIVAILAVLKAGGAYLPVDIDYPIDRKSYILKDCAAGLLVTQHSLMGMHRELFTHLPHLCCVLVEDEANFSGGPLTVEGGSNPEDPAYVIYTSGTTGRPNGVVVMHRGLPSLNTYFRQYFGVTPRDRILQFAGCSFDASVWEIYMALLNGSALFLVTTSVIKDYERFSGYLIRHAITIATLPPTYVVSMDENLPYSMRILITAGSASSLALVNKWENKLEYVNAYGPTETTICATAWFASRSRRRGGSVPIGRPINNSRIFIVDPYMQPQPVGVPGELCIAGISLAAGYANQVELTADKFPLTPPAKNNGGEGGDSVCNREERVYRTGDLARWLEDGNIEFLGRIDTQVKIRGFRIELEEIANCLRQIDSIRDAVVIDREDKFGDKFLCAYLVTQKTVDAGNITDILAGKLPRYMIPSFYTRIAAIPLTPNGKPDRKALPEPGAMPDGGKYVAPRNDDEALLAQTWKEVLGAEKIGIDDDFFSLGGDSIKAIRIVTILKKNRLLLDVTQLFILRTIRFLSKYLNIVVQTPHAPQGTIRGHVPFTPIQKWFFKQNRRQREHFNQSVLLLFPEGIQLACLEKTLSRLVAHHDALRMIYPPIKGDPENFIQVNRGIEGKLFRLDVYNLDTSSPADIDAPVDIAAIIKPVAQKIQRSFALDAGPLVKVAIFNTHSGDYLLIAIHHFVVDAVSWRILLEDLQTGYRMALREEDILLPQKTDSFKYWARQQVVFASSSTLLRERDYWRVIDETPVEPLPTDTPPLDDLPLFESYDTVPIGLTEEETGQLCKEGNRAYNTELKDLLMAALAASVTRWTGGSRVLMDIEGHGRETFLPHLDVGRTVGWFTSLYPVLFDIPRSAGTGLLIKLVKETLRRVPRKGIGYGILKYMTPDNLKKTISFTTEPELVFNYLGQMDPPADEAPLFRESGLPAETMGELISPDFRVAHKILVEASQTNGKLEVSFFYSRDQYHRATIESLGLVFKKRLQQIIRHCLNKPETEKTPSDLGYNKLSIADLEKLYDTLKRNTGASVAPEIRRIYPLSPLQRDVFLYSLKDPRLCLVQNELTITGELEPERFCQSIHLLFNRYDAADSIFLDGFSHEPLRVVLKGNNHRVWVQDLSERDVAERERYIGQYREEEEERGLDIQGECLVRIALFKTAEAEWRVLWSFHHILMNGHCFFTLFEELTGIYAELKEGRIPPADPLLNYDAYNRWLQEQDEEEGLAYWKDYFDGFKPKPFLACRREPADSVTSRYDSRSHSFQLDEELTNALAISAAEASVTFSTQFKVIWAMVLEELTGSPDVAFGTVVSGSPPEVEGIQQIIGLLVNTVPVRINLSGDIDFRALLEKSQQAEAISKKYEYLSLGEIQSHISPALPFIDHLLVVENSPIEDLFRDMAANRDGSFTVELLRNNEKTNFDFTVGVMPGDVIRGVLLYNSFVFKPAFIQTLVGMLEEAALKFVKYLRYEQIPQTKTGNAMTTRAESGEDFDLQVD